MKKIKLYDFEVEYLKEGKRVEKVVGNNAYFIYFQNGQFVAYRRLKDSGISYLYEREAMNPTKFRYEVI